MNLKRFVLPIGYLMVVSTCTPADLSLAVVVENAAENTASSPTSTLRPDPTQRNGQNRPISEPTVAVLETTPQLKYLPAIVWADEPRVPVLTYHRFIPDTSDRSTRVKTRLSDFLAHLDSLYESGFSLVSLSDWLSREISIPEGRRPLILTMDDLFYADQITLTEQGDPTPDSGLGVLWRFYQEHPDFGFSVALFPNLGDKLYPGGEEILARVIAWCIDHDAIPYNHFYTHPRLNLTGARGIILEAQRNDRYLRQLLRMIERADLIPKLGNIIALTYGEWPESIDGRNAIKSYTSPEGLPVQAILEVDFAIRARFLAPPYSPDFDPWHVPRIVGTQDAIDLLADQRKSFPSAEICSIGPIEPEKDKDRLLLENMILALNQDGVCPEGYYWVEHYVFHADAFGVTLLSHQIIDAANEPDQVPDGTSTECGPGGYQSIHEACSW